MNEDLLHLEKWLAPDPEPENDPKPPAPAAAPAPGNLNPVDAQDVAAQSGSTKKRYELDLPKLSMRTPGNIAALLLFVLFLVFAILPTRSGKTRLQLIWLSFTSGGKLRNMDPIDNDSPDSGAAWAGTVIPWWLQGSSGTMPGGVPGTHYDPAGNVTGVDA
jgi:hypothetical protein